MGKALSGMSLEELWQLFPIFLTEHQDCWDTWYAEEKAALENIIPQAVRIEHIGSTAVSTIWAKPIIDILMEIPRDRDMAELKDVLTKNGYICMSHSPGRYSFNKGYTEQGFAEKVFHLHLRYLGDNDELYFRDYLIEHPDIAHEYEKMKLTLWKQFEHDRDGYTRAKAEFVQRYTGEAKAKYGARYE